MSKININKYLGKWYEIARIPNDFQKNMTNVTAHYSLNQDNTINIINSGYINDKLIEVTANAITTDKDDLLLVSFTPHNYSEYNILAIDETYQNALVGGKSKNQLWILARMPKIEQHIYQEFINLANKKGYNIKEIKISK